MTPREARAVFEQEVPTIEALTRSVCRRSGLEGDEADGFASWVMVRILEDDLAILRKFAGRSSLKTYLAVVIANLYRDYRVKEMGRWHPSAAAKRLGHAGLLLDTFLNRKGHPLEEAIQLVLSRDDVEEDEATLREYAAKIPRRTQRRFTRSEAALDLAADTSADDLVHSGEDRERLAAARAALEQALGELPEQDQVILRMHYWEGLTVASIARALQIDQKPLYRRIEADLRRLRAALESQGLGADDVTELLPL